MKKEVIYHYGPAGVGKTYQALQQLKQPHSQKTILLDDVHRDSTQLEILKTEHGFDKIIITSNYPPPDHIKDKITKTIEWKKG